MGNRAVITLDNEPTENSTGIYLHWNGGPESFLAFAEAARHFGISFGDDSYGVARLAQITGNYFGGTYSIGVGRLGRLDCDNFDNGVYILSHEGEQVVLEQSKDGKNPWKRLNNDEIRTHEYWQGEENILDSVIEANKAHFEEDNTKENAAPDLLATLSRLIDAAVEIYDGRSDEYPALVRATEEASAVYTKAKGGN